MSNNQTNNRQAATEADVDKGDAVFFVPDKRSRPYSLDRPLPARAQIAKPIRVERSDETIPAGTNVEVVQVEIVDEKDILVGFVNQGVPGVCMLEEIELIT